MIKKTFILSWALCVLLATAALAGDVPTYKIKRDDVEGMSREMQGTLAGLQYMLNGYQVRQFIRLESDEARQAWLDKFWAQRDPTPTTPENQMKTEHEVRVRLAREFFYSRKWPGWDKRGETFIRYGPPDVRGTIPADITSKEFIPAREIWFYRKHYMLISYQNFGTTNEFIYSIDPLGISEEISPDLMEFLLYDTQHAISGKIPLDMLNNMMAAPVGQIDDANLINYLTDPLNETSYELHSKREVDDRIDAPLRGETPDLLNQALTTDIAFLFNKDEIQEVANNYEITIEETPVSYPFNFEQNDLPFYFGVDQFRGGGTSNRVDVSVEVPVVVENEGTVGFEETFHAEVVVWDPEYNEVTRKSREIVLKTDADVPTFANLLPTLMTMSLERGYYRMAVSVRGENSGRESSFKTAFSCEPFVPDLSLSDIMFARKIAPAGRPSVFMRGALEVVPHPFRHYGRTFAIPIYFEIYNLALSTQGTSSYTVEYKIIPHDTNKRGFFESFDDADPVVSSRFQSSGFGESETQRLSINTANLRKGSYDLLITITDDLSGTVAYSRGTFSLIE